MIQKIFSRQTIIFLGIILLAFLLRFYRYELFPVAGETADEYAWTLFGASLIQEGIPASWSYFSAYDEYHYQEGVFNAPIVRPVLDHPPLFALIPGLFHTLKGFWLDYPSIKVIRLPLLLLGSLNVGLFWLVLKQIFRQPRFQLLGALLFMTIPEIVWGSRLVVSENLLITWILLAMLVLGQKKNPHSVKWLIGLSAAAVLTKVSGLILPGSLIVYGLLNKQREYAKAGMLGAAIGLVGFALYGAYYNWQLFMEVWGTQSSRLLGLVTLQNRLFLHPSLVQHTLFDGWKILGLLGTVYMFAKTKRDQLIVFAQSLVLTSLLFIAVSVGETTIHGWYDLILWPGLVLILTALAKDVWQENKPMLFGFAWLWLLPTIRLALHFTGYHEHVGNLVFRLLILLGFLPLGLQFLGKKAWVKPAMAIVFGTLITANVLAVLNITHENYWLQAQTFVREVVF